MKIKPDMVVEVNTEKVTFALLLEDYVDITPQGNKCSIAYERIGLLGA